MYTIDYRHNFPLAAADVAAVFDSSGIRRPTGDLLRIERMFANANLTFSAWHDVSCCHTDTTVPPELEAPIIV